MDKVLEVLKMLWANWDTIIASITLIIGGAYTIALLIPGEMPDKQIKWLEEMTKKLSRK